jgi:hypothetical protein
MSRYITIGLHEKPLVLFEIHVETMQKDKQSPKKKTIRNLGMLIQIFSDCRLNTLYLINKRCCSSHMFATEFYKIFNVNLL